MVNSAGVLPAPLPPYRTLTPAGGLQAHATFTARLAVNSTAKITGVTMVLGVASGWYYAAAAEEADGDFGGTGGRPFSCSCPAGLHQAGFNSLPCGLEEKYLPHRWHMAANWRHSLLQLLQVRLLMFRAGRWWRRAEVSSYCFDSDRGANDKASPANQYTYQYEKDPSPHRGGHLRYTHRARRMVKNTRTAASRRKSV